MIKKKLDQKILAEELKRYKTICEYSFYSGNNDSNKEANKLLFDEGDDNVDNEPQDDPNLEGNPVDNQDTTQQQPEMQPQAAPVAEPQGNDEVELDVTQLVQGTDDVKASADLAIRKMEDLLNKFNDMEAKLNNMDTLSGKIDKLGQEVVKRNPTQVEKLELRSLDSYPYNIKLSDFWNEKEGNQDSLEDENDKQPKEYVLTKDDIKQEYSAEEIKDSFNDYDEEDF